MRPLFIQDARKDPDCKGMKPALLGLTRYLGVPVYDPEGKPIGTLCFLDGRTSEPCNEEDMRFMTLLALRISSEMAREQFIRERLAAQREVVDRQEKDLLATHQVLSAMNAAFEMVGSSNQLEQTLDEQARILKGILGYRSAAVLAFEGADALGSYISRRSRTPKRLRIPVRSLPSELARADDGLRHGVPELHVVHEPGSELAALMGDPTLVLASLHVDGLSGAALVLGCQEAREFGSSMHMTHLSALAEQVSLVLGSQILHSHLESAHSELRATQRQLVQSEKLSIVGTLAASTAHDIRNIMASISLELEHGMGDAAERLTSVKAHVDRFGVLAHRLLSYAKPRMVAQQPVDVGSVLQRVLSLTSAQLRISNVTPHLQAPTKPVRIIADEHQLEHLFVNLVMNSVQAMGSRGGALRIAVTYARNELRIEISDTGAGMTTEQLARLFEPFVSSRPEGFGLGLYSCKRIVQEHNGTIQVRSKVGSGTKFLITLPWRE